MSKEEIRFRLSRNFVVDTDLGRMAGYISRLASSRGKSQSDLLFDLICAAYLPFAMHDARSVEAQIQVIQSIYFLESLIRQILIFSGIDDPRTKGADVAHAVSLNPDDYLGKSEILSPPPSDARADEIDEGDEADEVIEADEEDNDISGSSPGIQSTINRMML